MSRTEQQRTNHCSLQGSAAVSAPLRVLEEVTGVATGCLFELVEDGLD